MNALLQNDNFLRACLRQPTDHTPIWLMRQAGRYLPEYRASRVAAGNSFMSLATNPQYATEVTLQPLDRYQLDAAILFSDILTVPDAMGLGLSFGVCPQDFNRLQQGDVLITRNTGPAFNVVLPLLGAIVTDRGGQLSHAAIVAREYGIPAVVGTREATTMFPDGARVRVNGDKGVVELVEAER